MSEPIAKIHDHFFRDIMTDKRVARDFFATHLPEDLRQTVDLNHLELLPESNTDAFLRESIADLVFKTQIHGLDAYLALMIEHQSSPDPLMALRCEKYRCDFLWQHIKQNPGTKTIPLVIPLVLYHGRHTWKYSTDVRDLIDAPKLLVDQYGFKPYLLIDLNTIDDHELKRHAWSGVMDLALKHIFARDVLPHLKNMMTLLQQLDQADGWSVIETVIKYLLDRGQMDKQDFITVIQRELTPALGEKIMTVSEQLIAEGMHRGIQQGMQQGVQQGMRMAKLDDARKMLAKGLDEKLIVEITDLSPEEIRAEAKILKQSTSTLA